MAKVKKKQGSKLVWEINVFHPTGVWGYIAESITHDDPNLLVVAFKGAKERVQVNKNESVTRTLGALRICGLAYSTRQIMQPEWWNA